MISNIFDLIGRILISSVFLVSSINKIRNYENTYEWMEDYGVPGFLLTPTIIFEILAPLMIIVGFKARIAGVFLSLFCLTTALIFLNDLPNQLIGFLKNFGLAGGFLFIVINGTKDFSLDKKLSK
tara:strand:+ start:1128 stop:1502 length:375 start_codon:yes stop_codon:yes gene_type:complete